MNALSHHAKVVPVILCGGQGARLWPRSRSDRPKPFLPLLGERTLFQETLDRCSDQDVFAAPLIVAGEDHVALVAQQANELNSGALIVEPAGRNTAPAIALAAARLDPDDVMLICPSDHCISKAPAFLDGIGKAAELARAGKLVSLAVQPDRAHTGYGYLKRGEPCGAGFLTEAFVEKPAAEDAERFFASGEYYWNSGIFLFRAGVFLDELARYRPAVASAAVQSVANGKTSENRFHPDVEMFKSIEAESIDYAVMELTSIAAMVVVEMQWSDIGNWAGVHESLPVDESGNHQSGDVLLNDCKNVMVSSDGARVTAIGLTDVCVVVDGADVLIVSRAQAEAVGDVSRKRKI